MIRFSRFPVLFAATLLVCACQPKTEEPDSAADESTADESTDTAAADAAPALALLDACKIRMTQPIAHEWDTKWNPAHSQAAGTYPSGVRSTHWGDEHEQKTASEMGTVIPFEM